MEGGKMGRSLWVGQEGREIEIGRRRGVGKGNGLWGWVEEGKTIGLVENLGKKVGELREIIVEFNRFLEVMGDIQKE